LVAGLPGKSQQNLFYWEISEKPLGGIPSKKKNTLPNPTSLRQSPLYKTTYMSSSIKILISLLLDI
jgi:hypothetical protein